MVGREFFSCFSLDTFNKREKTLAETLNCFCSGYSFCKTFKVAVLFLYLWPVVNHFSLAKRQRIRASPPNKNIHIFSVLPNKILFPYFWMSTHFIHHVTSITCRTCTTGSKNDRYWMVILQVTKCGRRWTCQVQQPSHLSKLTSKYSQFP